MVTSASLSGWSLSRLAMSSVVKSNFNTNTARLLLFWSGGCLARLERAVRWAARMGSIRGKISAGGSRDNIFPSSYISLFLSLKFATY